MLVIIIIYMILGYWAAGQTIYADRVIVEFQPGAFFIRRVTMGTVLGWVLIPWAVIKMTKNR